jgi:hypothetical protein
VKNYIAILIVLVLACKNDPQPSLVELPPEESQIIMVKLEDSLGTVSITLPKRYDTSFQWTHYSDCNGCEQWKYRFQSSSLPIYKESGFYWDVLEDSVENLTIVHSPSLHRRHHSDSVIFYFHNEEKIGPNQAPDTTIIFDTLMKISDGYFSVVGREEHSMDSIIFKQLKTQTFIGGTKVQLIFELKAKNRDPQTDNFLSNSFYYIKQISISDNHKAQSSSNRTSE